MVAKLVEYFLPARLRSDTDNLRAERIFISVLLISTLSNLLGINMALELDIVVIAYLLFVNASINILLLYFYKNGLSKTVATHLSLSQHAVSFLLQAYFQGGLTAPASAAFFLLPAVAILVLGKKPAVWWVIISVMMTTIIFIYESSIGPIPIKYDLEKQQMFFFSSLVATNVTIFFILLVYENSKNRALETVERKNADLISTQSQLIESEKMASLGELTAGIAHEIQNPLNFVNNFSEVNMELIAELKEELESGNLIDVKAIANDITINEQKILHHGKRADAIVKAMLQHSRTSTEQKELTDINALADEYLRLSYHGLRAKDKSFNADLKIDFDPNLPNIGVIPQDMGRVLLNLFNNAFYAVNAKKLADGERMSAVETTNKLSLQTPPPYEPTVTLTTKNLGDRVEISVKDNGDGIPEEIKNKIFQPFFTTKPTGKGTGLGLSLSYDIVKAHGGELKAESDIGEGTRFFITLPNSNAK